MLNLLKNGEVIRQVVPGSTLNQDGLYTSPAYAGWGNGEYELVELHPAPEPEPLAPEELRALMPIKSMVEFPAALRAIRTLTVPDGIYAADINAKISEIVDRNLQEEARDYFNLGQYAERLNAWVDIIGTLFGLAPEEIDSVW